MMLKIIQKKRFIIAALMAAVVLSDITIRRFIYTIKNYALVPVAVAAALTVLICLAGILMVILSGEGKRKRFQKIYTITVSGLMFIFLLSSATMIFFPGRNSSSLTKEEIEKIYKSNQLKGLSGQDCLKKGLNEENYKKMTAAEKKELLGIVLKTECDYLGIGTPGLAFRKMSSQIRGQSGDDHEIVINTEILESEEEALETLFHEVYHEYQRYCVKAYAKDEGDLLWNRTVKQWESEMEQDEKPEDKGSYLDYYLLSIESTARDYSRERSDLYKEYVSPAKDGGMEINMKDIKTLVKPEIQSVYLKNEVNEKVTYLSIPQDFCSYSLDEDIKRGAYHFKEVSNLLKKDHISKIISITADNMEMGLMAVTYISFRLKNLQAMAGDLPFDADNDEDAHTWFESGNRVPVIHASELSTYLNTGNIPFDNEGLLYVRASVKQTHEPFWRKCTREAVCIVVNREQFYENNLDFIDLFTNNKQVFVLFLDYKEAYENDSLDELPFGPLDKEKFRALKNNFILSCAADEVNVSFEDNSSDEYYANVLKENLRQRGIKVSRGFSYNQIVNLAKSVNKRSICGMIDKTVQYAIKDRREDDRIVLKNSDFAFIDHFMRKPLGKKTGYSGRELLERNLVGIPDIKEQVYDIVNVMKYNKLRSEKNIPGGQYHNVHIMLGAPGTAKTTVAKYMGQIMFDEKLLPDNRFICVNGAELKGMYVGHSAPKTKALFEKYDVIIIDEAYSIVESGGSTDSFGNEAIAQLIIELERHSTDKLVIFAGYGGNDVSEKENRMRDFLEANPGIKSRITSTFLFRSYTAEDMAEIFKRIAAISNYELPKGAGELVRNYFEKRVDKQNFGNGREARALLENVSLFAAKRLMNSGKRDLTAKQLKQIMTEDILNAIKKTENSYKAEKTRKKIIGFSA